MGDSKDSKYYGEPLRFDPTFKGPLKGRSCTDIICLLLFLAFMTGWGVLSWYAFTRGDLNRLLVPTDSNGKKCGVDSDVKDRPYLIFFDISKCADISTPITGCKTPQVCVESCPSEFFLLDTIADKQDTVSIRKKLICVDGFDKNTNIIDYNAAKDYSSGNDPKCARYYLKSDSLSKRCIPYKFDSLVNLTNAGITNEANFLLGLTHFKEIATINGMAQVIVDDVISAKFEILMALVISMFVCLFCIFLMRWLAAPVVWISIIGAVGILGFSVYYSATKYVELKDQPQDPINISPNLESVVKSWLGKSNTWLWILIITSVVLAIILLIVLVLRKRIIIAIALIKEGSKAVSSITSSVFFPIFPWVLQVLIIIFFVAVGLFLASVGDMDYRVSNLVDSCICKGPAAEYKNNETCSPSVFAKYCKTRTDEKCPDTTCNFKGIDNPHVISYMQAYNIFGFLWAVFFISAFGEMVLASTFATWYWTFHKSDVPFFTVFKGMRRTIRYHLGTLAFGSLIITICRIIRAILEYVDQKLKKYDNEVTKAIMCCCKCFFWCLEKFLKFLNKNAYIMCAIHGKNFCFSAKDAFNLLMRNFLRVIAIDKVTDFLFFLSKILISVGMAYLAYAFYSRTETVNYKLVPMVIVFIGTYIISTVFFNVYSMAVDTLFLCFLEDCERNDGSEEKPYFMSKQLMKILEKKNVVPRNGYEHH